MHRQFLSRRIKSFYDSNRYNLIIDKIRSIYSNTTNIPKNDISTKDFDDFIHFGGLSFHNRYQNFIERLEKEFGIPLMSEFWNDDENFKDITNDKYRTFGGIAEYIFLKTTWPSQLNVSDEEIERKRILKKLSDKSKSEFLEMLSNINDLLTDLKDEFPHCQILGGSNRYPAKYGYRMFITSDRWSVSDRQIDDNTDWYKEYVTITFMYRKEQPSVIGSATKNLRSFTQFFKSGSGKGGINLFKSKSSDEFYDYYKNKLIPRIKKMGYMVIDENSPREVGSSKHSWMEGHSRVYKEEISISLQKPPTGSVVGVHGSTQGEAAIE